MKKYKKPPSPDTAVLTNAAWHPPKEQIAKKNQKVINDKKPKLEIASTKEVSQPNKFKKKTSSVPRQDQKSDIPSITAKLSEKTPNSTDNTVKHPELPRPGECFECRQKGHIFKECPNKRIFKFFCYSCGRANLIASKCPTCKKEVTENTKGDQPT